MKHLQRFFNWLKSLCRKEKEEEVTHFQEIPLQDAFNMWRMEQRRKEALKDKSI